MRIDSLRLVNFRCFEDQTFRFEKAFTFIVAPNGGGKTTLLDALSILAGSVLLRVAKDEAPDVLHGDARATLYPGAPEANRRATRELSYPIELNASGVILGEPGHWMRGMRLPSSEGSLKSPSHPLADRLKAAIDRAKATQSISLPVLAYYRTNRLWVGGASTTPTDPDSILAAWRGCLLAGASWTDTAQWWRRETEVALQRGARPALLTVQRVAQLVTGASSTPYFDLDLNDVVADFDGHLHLFRELSDGQKNLLGLFSDLARRCADLNPHFGADAPALTEGVVLIDELDLHLHPTWQRRIVDLLRAVFPKLQFIVGTHAPQVLTDARPGEILVLRDRDGQPEPMQIDIPPGLTADQVLTGPWYGLESTLDDDTLGLLRRHMELLRLTEPTPPELAERAGLLEMLRRRLRGFGDTSEERMAQSLIAELSADDPPLTQEDRADLRARVMERLRARAP